MNNRPVRPRTRETYESQLKHILPRFEYADLGEITPHDVRVWHGQLMRSGMNRNTAAKVYRLFRTIMGTAVDDGLLAPTRSPSRAPRPNGSSSAHS
jgi:hypothetical protein